MNNFKLEELSDWKNEQSWKPFFSEFSEFLKALAFSYKLQPQDVDDVIQEIFISIASSFRDKKFDPTKGNIYAWVKTLAKWRIIDNIRQNQTKNKYITSGDDLLMEQEPDHSQNSSVKNDFDYRRKLLNKAIKNLGKSNQSKDYNIFYDMHVHKMSNTELAEKYQTNPSTIYFAKHKTIKKIKEEIMRILDENPNY